LSLEPTAPGDPRLAHHQIGPPEASLPVSTMVLSLPAAHRLEAGKGQIRTARLGRRRPDGILESVKLQFKVAEILPAEALEHHIAFMAQEVLEDMQDYRDYIAVPRRGYSGDPAPAEERRYESFRLYARTLNDVEPLDAYLRAQGIEMITKAREIANIRRIDESLDRIFLVVALAVGAGFVAFTVSSVLAAVRRKDRMLGMLRLLGFPRLALLLYPVTQTLFTGFCGVLLAGGLSLGAAAGINALFGPQFQGVSLCVLKMSHFLAALVIVLVLAVVGSVRPALRTARIDPSRVIRDV
jgi:putative ABC transport system permease protein